MKNMLEYTTLVEKMFLHGTNAVLSEIDGRDLVEVNWRRGVFNQLRDIKLAFMRAGYKLFGEIRLEDRKWEGEIVAKNSVDVVLFHVV